ncbi:ABC transporter substrate-binding protein [Pelagibacteraceae bacterium]|jgi:putative spermidine/putrescine transport system substrate-binding protein|nr:ABC transporter substrate-binding protein [Pelagibacteraceae bacterium]MDA9632672.1 ABC transporter substrate-binding protein [Pelagibacteraceae bacterium]MDC0453354.1 ABC transporter substrate-binding protein [Alphaproteobacteria bacterium]
MSKLLKVFLIASFAVASFSAKAVTVVSWGGAYTESQQKAYADTYSDPSSIQFENYNGGLGEVRAQVESGSVTWDLVDVLPGDAITGCDEGLFEDISSDIASNAVPGPDGESMLEDMENNGLEYHSGWDCCVPQIFWTYVVFFDPDAFPGEKPSTIADFFDVEKFPGKRGIHTWATGVVEKAMVADGVKPNAVPTVLEKQTGALDRAFAKLDTIKDHVVFWSAGSQPLELVKSGEVVMAIAYNGRVGAANLAEGENFEYIWEGQVLDQEYLCLMTGAPNRDAAMDFMWHASTPEAQAEQAKYITYGPMRASGIPIIQNNEPWGPGGVDIMPHMPNTPERLAVSIVSDPQWWSDNGAEINERYAAWMGN